MLVRPAGKESHRTSHLGWNPGRFLPRRDENDPPALSKDAIHEGNQAPSMDAENGRQMVVASRLAPVA